MENSSPTGPPRRFLMTPIASAHLEHKRFPGNTHMNFDWFLRALQEPQIQRALFGAVLIGFTNGILSVFIVIRRLSLMADAISHSLLPGLAIAILLFGLAPATLVAGASLAALLVALGTQIIANSTRIKEDTALGLLFACAFFFGVAVF